MASKMVYSFGGPKTDGHGGLRNLLGGKGANLAEMAKLGLPVPAGFTITTEVCDAYYRGGKKLPPSLKKEVNQALAGVEKHMGAKFGSAQNPLLVSCRSGARVSMPGMMDTVLNIGLNDQTAAGLIAQTGNPRFVYDSYRRFVAMYGDVVMDVKAAYNKDVKDEKNKVEPFGQLLDDYKKSKKCRLDTELSAEDLKELTAAFKELVRKTLGRPFPEDPQDQLWGAVAAVFDSWMIERAKTYRRLHGYPESWGTAVNVQAMVFGNKGDDSATGVAFSRDPSTGDNYFYGEYLVNAQGEDVVAGVRTPNPINRARPLPEGATTALADEMPKLYRELDEVRRKLEKHYRDMQDIEFTIQEGKLWMLQCRNGKRTAQAAINIAVDLVKEKLITRQEAILRVEPEQIGHLLLPIFDQADERYKNRQVLAKGLPASPGAAVGQAVFSASDAVAKAAQGQKVILVRQETSPEDIKGMNAAQGILTSRGGMTSHAAVVGRGMGRPCVVGASAVLVDAPNGRFTAPKGQTTVTVKEGDWLSLNGTTGEITLGALPTTKVELGENYQVFMNWVEAEKVMKVRTNADTPHDAQVARDFGAEGIGLCRTEHMFFESDRIDHIRAMILADDETGRQVALDKLLPMQRDDFYGIFKAMDGLPVTIRTLDPPLHEFLPHSDEQIAELAAKFSLPLDRVKARISALQEQNPMLGLRGCRLGILYPEITAMQAQAILEAAVKAAGEGVKVLPEIMIPLAGHEKEFTLQKAVVDDVALKVFAAAKTKVDYLVGTMIELPRAALIADRLARAGAQFFSFGTNDLTQTTYGLSRDDSGIFLPHYLEQEIWPQDPFVTIDQDGLGQLVTLGVQKGRSVDRKLKVGICGEHGGDPASVIFCHGQGFDYVSCSPLRVAVARAASAQATIAAKLAAKAARKDATPAKTAPDKKAEKKADKKDQAAKKPDKKDDKKTGKASDKKVQAKKPDKAADKKVQAKKPPKEAAAPVTPGAKSPKSAKKAPAPAKGADKPPLRASTVVTPGKKPPAKTKTAEANKNAPSGQKASKSDKKPGRK
jgi:pyruvate,orthophosphate dikinase